MSQIIDQATRRDFLKQTTGIVAGLTVGSALQDVLAAPPIQPLYSLQLGVYAAYNKATFLKESGCTYIEESVAGFLIPPDGDAQYEKNLQQLRQDHFPIKSYVILLPGSLKTLGPDANHEAILQRTELVLKRAKECGSQYVVFGSGASRVIPDGFDRAIAKAQHIELTKKMAPLAEKYGVTIAVEPLNRGETNFINSLAEGVEIVDAVKSPRIKLLCDIYHMLKEDESPLEIVKYGKHIVHCHIAEKESRTPPGVKGDDFRPYLSALKKINYKGGLSIECFVYTDFDKEAKRGIEVLKQQLSEV
ncbi:sugar phosphate isomerase/epimerase family protein [Dyadobacter pollutisoli]|uniref:Sugar phosphate isomerase/epimerase n=1 Tax=Dyadobacter pollutisoli TaxID=2910158 RepID=A0A9E8N9J9_9BACT|nr:sugar phosphate isomerase/epimerase family protein [Dyadobacter pollutisoli]WAC10422.1 sugar phosphate isomerase/epimerase [Dyadobacter pollutisoli]